MPSFDYRGQQCPFPVVETRKQILAHPDLELTVLVDDDICRDNVTRLAVKMRYQTTATQIANGFELQLVPPPGSTDEAVTAATSVDQAANSATVIYCGRDSMGTGDEQLGRILLKNFLLTQLEIVSLPAAILFVNSGIHLTTEGSEVLEELATLNAAGVDIASCGLCLDFYHKKEHLKVGRVTNMLEIVEIQNQAGRVICP